MDSAKRKELVNVAVITLVPFILILHNFNYYKLLLFYKDSYLLFLFYFIIPIAFYFLLRKIFHFSATASTLITLSLSIFFFFFGAIQDFLLSHSLTYYLGKTYILLVVCLLPILYLIFKRPEATALLKFLGVIIFFFFLTEVLLLLFNTKHFDENMRLRENTLLSPQKGLDSFNIYHIIFDGYTNSKTLQTEFGFTNPIDSFLLKKGFFVAANSKSNYNFTPYSLASLLGLQYLDTREMQLERNYKNYLLGSKLYHDNPVFRFFEAKTYTVQSFCILEDYKHLDKLGTFVPKTPTFSVRSQTLERIFLNPWLWQKLSGTRPGTLPASVKNSLHYYVEYNEKALENVLTTTKRNQVYSFTHFLLPHEPYVYIKTTIDSLTEPDLMDYAKGYIMQVQYVNNLIQKLVSELQKNKNNIIIIQGDHGFRDYNFTKVSNLKQLEILNAVYFPDKNYSLFTDSISLVNTYRIVLSQYFQQDLPLLNDRYYTPSK